MGAQDLTGRSGRGRSGRHRRNGDTLITRREHHPPRPRRSLPVPSASALVGIAVLVLIGLGAVHLSGSGSAVPLGAPAIAPTVESSAPAVDGEEDGAAGEQSTEQAGEDSGASPPTVLIVHVTGAVESPGVVRLEPGARVDDALAAAGGAQPEADLAAVNLARPVSDGEQIHVPVPGEEPRELPADPGGGAPSGGAEPEGSDPAGPPGAGALINLNTATAAELEDLPGVGPAIAERIITHREQNGPFTSVDQLQEVSGIGPATLEKIRPQATV
ncbi:helix-hairpin-helix domain-containing protein [Brachybacterium sp. UMB0905]|uniref:helix-hairpin-helix domain-containing protein n=1 Tax=Brachybacterium sp. UMB0905 TaxID=2069310 RepID=UPI000C7FCD97|nr:helix-hairpin-helix domain-containing protein [Brachybacterium sp. UMB0905]PMC75423.1 competence protein ComEA [Brachybacterium sp. UMB0905]